MPYLLACSYKLLFVQAVDKSVVKKKQTCLKVPSPLVENAFVMGDVNAIMNEENRILLLLFIPLLIFSTCSYCFICCKSYVLLIACGKLEYREKQV